VDLTAITAFAIDDADSSDPDDAISFADGLLLVLVAESMIAANSAFGKWSVRQELKVPFCCDCLVA
jgi:exoribonuclease R